MIEFNCYRNLAFLHFLNMSLYDLGSSDADVTAFLNEALIMKDFNHPNVLTLIGITLDKGEFPMVILPFMQNGSLLSYIRNENNVGLMNVEQFDCTSDIICFFNSRFVLAWCFVMLWLIRKHWRSHLWDALFSVINKTVKKYQYKLL